MKTPATVLCNLRVNEVGTLAAASSGYMNATELADYLVRKGMPFREAHETVGRIVLQAIDRKIELQELPIDEMKSFSSIIEEDVYEALSLESTLAAKSQFGGTSRGQVTEALAAARSSLET